jgi:hypothetical protein
LRLRASRVPSVSYFLTFWSDFICTFERFGAFGADFVCIFERCGAFGAEAYQLDIFLNVSAPSAQKPATW